jgi:Glyoxalase-like domain
MLEFDHVVYLVEDPEAAVRRLEDHGLMLAGQDYAGQGTRNRLSWTPPAALGQAP